MSDRWVERAARIVPEEIREPFLSDVLEERERMRAGGRGRWHIAWWTVRELAAGAAQHVRLPRTGGTGHPLLDATAAAGQVAWRISGAVILAGLVARWPLLLSGGFALAAFAVLAATALLLLPGPRGRSLVLAVVLGLLLWIPVTAALVLFAAPVTALVAWLAGESVLPAVLASLAFVAALSAWGATWNAAPLARRAARHRAA